MKTYFLIDGWNNNKVVTEVWSKKEAKEYIKTHEGDFSIVDSEQMAEAVRLYGSRKLNYWT